MAEPTPLDVSLRYWAADHEGTSVLNVRSAELVYDEGDPGTDVTPGEPPALKVSYTVVKRVVVEIPLTELGTFINRLAQYAAGGR